jgi:signal transduction histidine kinase
MPSIPDEERTSLHARLASTSSHERLGAARALARDARPGDEGIIRDALGREKVSFVRRALSQTLARLERGVPPPPPDASGPTSTEMPERVAYSKAVDWVATTLLHELLPRVGAIAREAQRTVPDYDQTRLKTRVDALTWLLDGVAELRNATVSQLVTDFLLAHVIRKNIASIELPKDIDVQLEGRVDIVAVGDPNLVSIALCSGVRNAIEACSLTDRPGAITISWGETEVDYWIAVIDKGPGFAGTPEAAFEIGRTTKRGHRGFGLAIARQAMETVDGSVALRPNTPTGAIYELRWFK